MSDNEVTYLERRAGEEAVRAERARCAQAVSVHYQMSKAYFERAEALKRATTATG